MAQFLSIILILRFTEKYPKAVSGVPCALEEIGRCERGRAYELDGRPVRQRDGRDTAGRRGSGQGRFIRGWLRAVAD